MGEDIEPVPDATVIEAKTPKPPADASAVFSSVEKYLLGAVAELGDTADSELASLRGTLSNCLAELRGGKPGG